MHGEALGASSPADENNAEGNRLIKVKNHGRPFDFSLLKGRGNALRLKMLMSAASAREA